MSFYQQLIIDTVACSPEDAAEIEDYMRDTIFCSTLSWQTKPQLQKAAKEAWGDIQYMRSPEGQAYIASILPY